jgi:hypothetical protein
MNMKVIGAYLLSKLYIILCFLSFDRSQFSAVPSATEHGGNLHNPSDSRWKTFFSELFCLPNTTRRFVSQNEYAPQIPTFIQYDCVTPIPEAAPVVRLSAIRLYPHRPELRTPPPLTAEGQPLQPIPEKSFIQKYWIYILVALGALRESLIVALNCQDTDTITFHKYFPVVLRKRRLKKAVDRIP